MAKHVLGLYNRMPFKKHLDELVQSVILNDPDYVAFLVDEGHLGLTEEAMELLDEQLFGED